MRFKKFFTLAGLSATILVYSAPAQEAPAPTGRTLARQFPYSMIGQLSFYSGKGMYVGSGTVVEPYAVLTAAHCLWNPLRGWSTQVRFTRSPYDDAGLSQQYASRKYILGGYASAASYDGSNSVYAFSNDVGGLRFPVQPANGSYSGWAADLPSLTGDVYNNVLGYGAVTHNGHELLSVEPAFAFYQTYGGFFENDSMLVEGGMSGGPVFAPDSNDHLHLVGVVVAGSRDSGGIRALTLKAANFINNYLR